MELRLARSSAEVEAALPLRLVGVVREVGHHPRLQPSVRVEPATSLPHVA